MRITDEMLTAAVRKAVELELLPPAEWTHEKIDENWRKIKQVLVAALAAGDDVPDPRLERARAAYDALRETLEIEHGRASEAERKLEDALRVNRETVEESRPHVVPCEDHPVLDVIATAIAPEFEHGRPDDVGPAEDVTREGECVEFTDPRDGRRYETVVRPIDDDVE